MLFVHENNMKSKILSNYKGCGEKIKWFYNEVYMPMRSKILNLDFCVENYSAFVEATEEFNIYYKKIEDFSTKNSISAQSKFASTFLEEISSYLFKDLPEIKNGTFGVYNKNIYAGLKIDNNSHISIISKDVDFCIGKKATMIIDEQEPIDAIIPVVAVEVKTYLDATMFGEIKSSSKSIRSASPNSKAYVLMGYKCIADEHIVAARQDSTLTEMFALRNSENSPILSEVIFEYWTEINSAVMAASSEMAVPSSGRLLKVN